MHQGLATVELRMWRYDRQRQRAESDLESLRPVLTRWARLRMRGSPLGRTPDDVAQDALIATWEGFQARVEAGERKWRAVSRQDLLRFALAVANAQVYDLYRKLRRLDPDYVPIGWLESPPAPSAEAVCLLAEAQRQCRDLFMGALASLPVERRLPLALHYLVGWSYERIATELRLNPSTIRSWARRFAQQFGPILKTLDGGGSTE